MSQYSSHAVNAPESNGLGLAGFICSILGLFTGGLLSPIGLILSLCALGRRPKGFAIAGVIVGLIGSCGIIALFIMLGIGGLLALVGIVSVIALSNNENVEITTDLGTIAAAVAQYEDEHGQLPADLSLIDIQPSKLVDPWGNRYAYHFKEGITSNDEIDFDLISAGEDGQFGNTDDVKLSQLGDTWNAVGPGFNMQVSGRDDGGTVLLKIGDKTLEVIGGEDGGHIVLRDGEKVIEIAGGDEGGNITIGDETDENTSDEPSTPPDTPAAPPSAPGN